jgi:hypothetical protein
MPDVKDGTPYKDWLRWAQSKDPTIRLSSEHEFVVLYDAKGVPQRVRGSNVPGMLAKRRDGEPVFFGENPLDAHETVPLEGPEPEIATGPQPKAPVVSKRMWRKKA